MRKALVIVDMQNDFVTGFTWHQRGTADHPKYSERDEI